MRLAKSAHKSFEESPSSNRWGLFLQRSGWWLRAFRKYRSGHVESAGRAANPKIAVIDDDHPAVLLYADIARIGFAAADNIKGDDALFAEFVGDAKTFVAVFFGFRHAAIVFFHD